MVNRREFIETGAAAAAAAALAGISIAGIERAMTRRFPADTDPTAFAAGQGARPHSVLFDERFASSRRFGATMRRQGFAVHAIRGDVTDVWYERLYPLWKRTPAPVAGLTAYAAMFCLERLAWDHGLRMTRYAAHGAGAVDPALHAWLIAAPERVAVQNV